MVKMNTPASDQVQSARPAQPTGSPHDARTEAIWGLHLRVHSGGVRATGAGAQALAQGRVRRVHYLSMEFLEGESLRSRLNKLRQIPTKTALRVARQIASALAAAHRVHIIHRDLKPDKIRCVEKRESKLPL